LVGLSNYSAMVYRWTQ